MEYLEDKTNTGPLEDGLYRFKCIKDHKGPYTSSDPEYNGSSYNLLIDWEAGEQTWEPLSNLIASDPYMTEFQPQRALSNPNPYG